MYCARVIPNWTMSIQHNAKYDGNMFSYLKFKIETLHHSITLKYINDKANKGENDSLEFKVLGWKMCKGQREKT